MMDFEGIEGVRQRVRQNGTLARQLAQMQAQMARLTGLLEAQEQPAPPEAERPGGGTEHGGDGEGDEDAEKGEMR